MRSGIYFTEDDVVAVAKCLEQGSPSLAAALLNRMIDDRVAGAPDVYCDASSINVWRHFRRPPIAKTRHWGGKAPYIQSAKLVCIAPFPPAGTPSKYVRD